ncbi:MAG: hypothetical protein ABEL51_12265 [Salinibacter sp.]
MKHTTRALLATFLVATALVLTGCFEKFGGTLGDANKIAFALPLVDQGQASDSPAKTFVNDSIAGGSTIGFETELIGRQRSSPTEVRYGVVRDSVIYTKKVPTDTGSGEPRIDSTLLARPTTAEEGTDYTIPGTYTLPADSSSANLPVQILDDGDSPGEETVRLTLRIDGNPEQNLEPAEQLRYLEVYIQPD